MNSIDFIQDKVAVMAALERAIVVAGQPVTNIDFAVHLFNCAKDLLPFEDSLMVYAYTESSFETPTLNSLKTCYNVGLAHVKRDLTHKMLHETDPMAQSRTDAILKKVFDLYVEPEEGGGSVNVTINTTQSSGDTSVKPEAKDVIVENEVPDAQEL